MATFGHRRSERVLLDVPLFIQGQADGAQEFKEETFTVSGARAESDADQFEE
jgi:hypothetical protein